TGDSGGYGGNMDFNEIVEGATVYLPVRNPGALLYFGDGHAAQGDGELTGAFRGATGAMARWLAEDYDLTPSEIAQVLGTSAEYRVSEVADRNAGIVLKINKERLRAFKPLEK